MLITLNIASDIFMKNVQQEKKYIHAMNHELKLQRKIPKLQRKHLGSFSDKYK